MTRVDARTHINSSPQRKRFHQHSKFPDAPIQAPSSPLVPSLILTHREVATTVFLACDQHRSSLPVLLFSSHLCFEAALFPTSMGLTLPAHPL